MLKLAAGLLLAAAAALLLNWYSPAASSAPAGLRRLRAPRPAPGAEAANLLWAVQVSGAPLKGSAAVVGVVRGLALGSREALRVFSVSAPLCCP